MPYDDNISDFAASTASVGLPKKKPVDVSAPAPAPTVAAPPVFQAAPIETPEQAQARAARQQLIAGAANYVAPAAYQQESREAFAARTGIAQNNPAFNDQYASSAAIGQTRANIAAGNVAPGAYAQNGWGGAQDDFNPSLSQGEAAAKRTTDFGLGAGNNAQTAAMLADAQATGNKFSSAFGDVAGADAANSAAAQARGLSGYAGNLDQYAQGLSNAQQSRGMQTQAYQGLMGLAPQTGAYDDLMRFANGPAGPSAAQTQLNQATDANMANTLALARSGRGMGGSQAAMRQAVGQNAGIQQQAVNQAASLRAQESQADRQNRLSALGTAGGLSSQADQTRLNALNSAGGVAAQTAGADQSYGQLGLAGAQYQSDTAIKGTQLNDASAQNWASQQAQALNAAQGAEMGAQTQGLNINSTALTGRENEQASATQQWATQHGLALQASIADANRQQAYVGAGLSAAGTVIGALSDERTKTNIVPLGGQLGGNDVKALPSQSSGSAMPTDPGVNVGAMKEEQDKQQRSQTGGMVGKAAGNAIGGAVGSYFGPLGTVAGSIVGGMAGKAIGKVFSDIRSKTNVRPLDQENPYGGGTSGSLPRPRTLDRDAFGDLEALAQKYGAGGVASKPKDVASYAKQLESRISGGNGEPKPVSEYAGGLASKLLERPGKKGGSAEARFARDESHPILSGGDALLADSARNAAVSAYDYANPDEPGAKPGRQIGPMAQDLARDPVTASAVEQDPNTGKLYVDGGRAAMAGLAQNHGQQNQLDKLNAKIAGLESMLKRKKGDSAATDFRRDTSFGGL